MTDHAKRKKNAETAQLIAGCQGLVRSIAWKVHRRLPPYVELDDLIGYGQVGLAEAARDYDPEHGTQFTTFAYYRIRGAILDGLSRLAWFSAADYNQGRYEHLAHEALHSDTDEGGGTEGAKLGDDIRWFKRATGALAVVHLMCHSNWEAGGREIASAQRTPVESAISSELSAKLRALVERLPKDARELVHGTYFEGLTLKEAGERIGISKAWASRLHARTLQQLARSLSAEND